jgi:transcriptional regulator with XRE-family HTH domain
MRKKQMTGLLGSYLKISRERAGLTQDQVARHCGYTSAQFVSNWERGIASPPAKTLKKLVALFDLPKKHVLKLILREQEIFWLAHLK